MATFEKVLTKVASKIDVDYQIIILSYELGSNQFVPLSMKA